MKLLNLPWTLLVPGFIDNSDISEEYKVVVRIWWFATACTALLLSIFTVAFYLTNVPVIKHFLLIHAVFWSGCLLAYAVYRKGIEWIGLTTQSFLVLSSFVFSVLHADPWVSSGFLVIGFIGPLYALAWPKRSRAIILCFIYCGTIVLTPMAKNIVPQIGESSSITGKLVFITTLISCALFSFLALLFFVRERINALNSLSEEQEKSERLLLNILPQPIADILRNENRVIADYYAGASVLFADVVGFTPMSSKMEPQAIVDLLNEIFSYLDKLVDKYGLEKIKTIGDCYMVASGIPIPRPDHAKAIVSMALDMRDYFSGWESKTGIQISFRIGINSGPVVAGVIGIKRFIYDLWGDAVNTASRMESHGKPNVIQITESTYELIRDKYYCDPQNPILVKGKGEMPVWYVIGRKPESEIKTDSSE